MSIKLFRPLSQKGDTIVEVLIAIAVMSLVLGGAFVMTNRNLIAARDAQERVNAVKLAEGQLEQIKSMVATTPDALFGAGVPATFCISNNTAVNSNNAQCTMDMTGAPTTNQPAFHVIIRRTGNEFSVRNEWVSARGNTQNNVQLVYRVYE